MTLKHLLHQIRLRSRCLWRTHGLHDLDLHTGTCRFCGLPWFALQPDTPEARKTADRV